MSYYALINITIPLSAVSFVASKVLDRIFTANFLASFKVICPSL